MRKIDADQFEVVTYKGTETFSDCFDNGVLYMLEQIDKAPTVDVHAHWVTNIYDRGFVRIDKDGFPEKSCYCSVCGDWLTASDEYAVRGYYCPNCGAKMDEVVST